MFSQIKLLFLFIFSLTIISPNISSATYDVVRVPGDFESIQAAINYACDNDLHKVKIAPGTYNESFGISCGIHVRGSGIDRTIIDGTQCPNCFLPPFLTIGRNDGNGTVPPFIPASSSLEESARLSHLTITQSDRPTTEVRTIAVNVLWSNNDRIDHIKITGFSNGIESDRSDNLTLDHNIYQGLDDADFSQGILFNEFGTFVVPGVPPFLGELAFAAKPFTVGHNVHHNIITDATRGMSVTNVRNSRVHHNIIKRVQRGIRIRMGADSSIHSNVIAHVGPQFAQPGEVAPQDQKAGISIESVAGVTIRNNFISDVSSDTQSENDDSRVGPAIRYTQTFIAFDTDLLGFGPNTDTQVHHNIFFGVEDDIYFNTPHPDDPNQGPSDGGDNEAFRNLFIPRHH